MILSRREVPSDIVAAHGGPFVVPCKRPAAGVGVGLVVGSTVSVTATESMRVVATWMAA